MARTFLLEIVTPEKVVWSEQVSSVILPAHHGYLGVLGGHAPMLATLQVGEVIVRGSRGDEFIATSGGFVEVMPDKTVLLVEAAEHSDQIDLSRAREAEKRARERLATTDRGVDRSRAEDALARAQNRVRLAEKRK